MESIYIDAILRLLTKILSRFYMKGSSSSEQNSYIHESLLSVNFDGIFNNVLMLVQQMFDSSFSQINLIGSKEHWRQDDNGLVTELCDDTALLSELFLNGNCFFEVKKSSEDSSQDNIIANEQLLINKKIVKYYAAIPLLLSDGKLIGSLSILNFEDRSLSHTHQSYFSMLAKHVVDQIELNVKNLMLENSLREQKAVIDLNTKLIVPNNTPQAELDGFMHRVVHDLKAPLNAIKNISSWIKEDIESGSTEDNDNHFTMINNSIKRMGQLLTDLMLYTQIGQEKESSNKINLQSFISENCAELMTNEKFNIKVEPCNIKLPKAPFLFVINQLLSNAIKHHHKSEGNIEVCCVSEKDFYKLSVTDDGPGIPEGFKHKIFDAFQKLKSKDEVEGSGLGLTMVRKTLAPYLADLHVESKENVGSTFIIIWPKK